jgi:class 3 adenylate cyclase
VSPGESSASIDEVLDRALRAINAGDVATATTLAGQVLSVDRGNPEAEDLLTAPAHSGEIRRLTIMFADLVDSTALSTRLEPETYHTLVGRYRDEVSRLVDRYEGHVSSIKGDGLLAVFGHPKAHENDVRRAVAAGLDITRAVAQLSEQAQRTFGVAINVRVGIHRGLVYLDTEPPAQRRGVGAAPRGRDGNALPRRRADARARPCVHRARCAPRGPGRRA